MIRHLKRDHLKVLGPKTRKIIFLDKPEKLNSYETSLLKHYTLDQLMGEDHELGQIATYRREVGETKIIPSFQYIHEWLQENDGKLVVFAHHISVVETLHRMLDGFHALMIRGGMSPKLKDTVIKEFQANAVHRVMVANMDACGVGVTLTAASTVIVVEPSWVPGVNAQAEDRCHRMTQQTNVYIHYLVLRESLDERMLSAVMQKETSIAKAMD